MPIPPKVRPQDGSGKTTADFYSLAFLRLEFDGAKQNGAHCEHQTNECAFWDRPGFGNTVIFGMVFLPRGMTKPVRPETI